MLALPHTRRVARGLLAGAALVLLLGVALWAWQLTRQAQSFEASISRLEASLGSADLASLPALCAQAATTTAEAQALRAAAGPLLAAGPWLAPLPRYGPELAAAGPLLAAAASLGAAADTLCAALPALTAPLPPGAAAPAIVTARLAAAQPAFVAARASLQRASSELARAPRAALAPALIAHLARADALLPRGLAALDLALAAPALLGADGPRTYLIVVQNPDELRPTGGFISAAGLLRLDGGAVVGLDLRDSAVLDSPLAAYPLAPEPLRRYMLLQPMAPALWVFRDANWSPDFPTSARQMLKLYRLGQGQGADAVLALTPEAVRLALAALGPVRIEGSSQPVSAANLEDALHTSYDDARAQGRPQDRKSFVSRLGVGLLLRAAQAGPPQLLALASAAERALDTRAAQLFLPPANPAAALLAARGWDGAVRPGPQDFLMVVSANVGYNKVGPSIVQQIRYAVDLSDPVAPRGALTVIHANRSPGAPGCPPLAAPATSYAAMTTGCYWNYLRALVPGGAALSDTEVPRVPDSWLLGGDGDNGRVYSERGPADTHAFGALLVVPHNASQALTFRYDLPSTVVVADDGLLRYRLQLQRQPGLAQRASIQLLLPPGADLVAATPAPQSRSGQSYSFELALDHDQSLEIRYRLP